MEQQRLKDYLNLIQKLLACPQGEEWVHLKHHEDLVDAQFVQVMEQVATQLTRQGNRETAIFLHNWAAKLHHILIKEIQPPSSENDQSEAYLDLIQQLLDCPEGKEDNVLATHQALIGPGLVHKMHEVAQQFIHQGEADTAQFLEDLAGQLNQVWLKTHDFQSNLKKTLVHREPVASTVSQNLSSRKTSQSTASTLSASAPTRSTPTPLPDIIDPWSASTGEATPSGSAPSPFVSTQPPAPDSNGARSVPAAKETSLTAIATPPSQANNQAIAEGLNAIAQALQQLNQTLTTQRLPHPLQYLEALEQAYAAKWQLTTEEIEQLIGVKPKCHGGEMVYQRGNWRFTKVGKLGGQTAWQVTKAGEPEDRKPESGAEIGVD